MQNADKPAAGHRFLCPAAASRRRSRRL